MQYTFNVCEVAAGKRVSPGHGDPLDAAEFRRLGRALIEQGAISMPSVRYEPLDSEAPMSLWR